MASGRVIASTLMFRPASNLSPSELWSHTGMANIKSQKKRILTNARRQERNKAVRSELKTRVKNADKAAVAGAEDTDDRCATR